MQQNVKILMMFSLMFVISACSCEPKVIKQTVEVKIPVKCKVPNVECDYKGLDNMQTIAEMIRCNYSLRESIKVCR